TCRLDQWSPTGYVPMKMHLFRNPLLGLAMFAALAVPAMAQQPAPDNPLALNAKAVKEAGIVLAKATPRVLTDELKAPGEVEANAYATVLVSPRVESQVLARKAQLGDIVEAGDPLVVLSSAKVAATQSALIRSEEHTSELQSRFDLVCRLLLEKK